MFVFSSDCVRAISISAVFVSSAVAQEPLVMEEVLVIGEKLGRSPSETASSAAILAEDLLETTTSFNVTDVFASIPNIAIEPTNGEMIVRGIPQSGFGGATATVSYFMDGGPYVANARYTTIPIWDLKQIEVLRGAQSTATISTVAGIVSLLPAGPTDQVEGKAFASYAPEGNQRSLGLALGGPVTETIRIRAAGHVKLGDGFISNIATDEDDWNAEDRRMLRLALDWNPNEWESTSLRVIAQRLDERIDGAPWTNRVNQEDGFDPFEREVDKDLPISTDNKIDLYVLNLEHEFNAQWAWRSIFSYHTLESSYVDAATTAANDPTNGILTVATDFDILSLENRLAFKSSKWDMTASVFLSDVTFRLLEASSSDIMFGELGAVQVTRRVTNRNEQQRVGAQILLSRDFSSNWSLDMGLRYQWHNPEGTGISAPERTGTTGVESFDTLIDQIIANTATAPSTELTEGDTFGEFLPVFSLSYEVTDSLRVGGKVERGMRWGAQSVNVSQERIVPFKAEIATSYELFWRQQLANGALELNANLFHTDFEDQQVFACFSAAFLDCNIVNAQKSRIRGMELSLSWLMTDTWGFRAGIGINDTLFQTFEVANIDWSGNEMPSPDQSLNLGVTYGRPTGLFVDAEALYDSGSFATPSNNPEIVRESRFLLNYRMGWRSVKARWEVSLYGRNLLDNDYLNLSRFDEPNNPFQLAIPGEPRILGAEIRVNW